MVSMQITPGLPSPKGEVWHMPGVVKIGRCLPREPGHFCTLFNTGELELLGQNGRNLILEDKMKDRLPKEWLDCFRREKQVFGVSRVFAKTSNQRATELYLLLFAFFYDSFSDILIEFEKMDHMATLFQLEGKDYSYELLYGEYIRNNGKVADIKESCSLSNAAVNEYLNFNGLPDLDGEHESDLNALNDFFSGQSLASVCEAHGANIGAIERLLRKSGARLARALNRMNTNTV
ncbi:hypothetical protein [Paludibacterium paludis]|uniref:Uncharacterized protein n=1 Tax=Paludibacterium paludis TaxID=1225769 RepID=A0A918UCB5_9NEIS|nr:hypothetical protein [Paludibacterium paludis]GGY29922.1 hypothetical protein GCM10011289_35990 [Paludibacterium paludis]